MKKTFPKWVQLNRNLLVDKCIKICRIFQDYSRDVTTLHLKLIYERVAMHDMKPLQYIPTGQSKLCKYQIRNIELLQFEYKCWVSILLVSLLTRNIFILFILSSTKVPVLMTKKIFKNKLIVAYSFQMIKKKKKKLLFKCQRYQMFFKVQEKLEKVP